MFFSFRGGVGAVALRRTGQLSIMLHRNMINDTPKIADSREFASTLPLECDTFVNSCLNNRSLCKQFTDFRQYSGITTTGLSLHSCGACEYGV